MAEKRRRNGEGTIFQRKDGYWSAQIDIGKDEDGKRLRRTILGTNYEEVAAEFDIERGRIQIGGGLIPTKITVGEWLDTWFQSVSPKLRPTTRDGYYHVIKRIKKYMGGSKLASLSIKQIYAFYAEMKKHGLSTATQKKTHIVFSKALDKAVIAHLLLYNPLTLIEQPNVEYKLPTVLSVADQRIFTAYCEELAKKGRTMADFFLLILETGMRFGEMLSLNWDDVQESKGRMFFHVNKTAARVYNDDPNSENKTVINVGKPKTKSGDRYIPATSRAQEIIARCKSRKSKGSVYVFESKNGTMLHERNLRRLLHSICEKLEINDLTIHSLRHTFSTRMYEAKLPSEERAKIMGHSDSRTTDRLYVTIDLDGISNAMDSFDMAMEKNSRGYNLATVKPSTLHKSKTKKA